METSVPSLAILPLAIDVHDSMHGLESVLPVSKLVTPTKKQMERSARQLETGRFYQLDAWDIVDHSRISQLTKMLLLGGQLCQQLNGLRKWLSACAKVGSDIDDAAIRKAVQFMSPAIDEKSDALMTGIDYRVLDGVGHDNVHAFAEVHPRRFLSPDEDAVMEIRATTEDVTRGLYGLHLNVHVLSHDSKKRKFAEDRSEMITTYMTLGISLMREIERFRGGINVMMETSGLSFPPDILELYRWPTEAA